MNGFDWFYLIVVSAGYGFAAGIVIRLLPFNL